MKKAINLYCVRGYSTKEKLDEIKKCGFDAVFLGYNCTAETMNLQQQIDYCKKIGLEISMIHCVYAEPKLNDFWADSLNGKFVEKNLINQIESIKNLGVQNFVIHTCGSKEVKNSLIGLDRLKHLLNYAKQYNINLCVENLYDKSQIDYIFKNLQDKNLRFCYDCGHENCFTKNANFAYTYCNLMQVVHLHDNFGQKDEHKTLWNGTINKEQLAKNLANTNLEYLSAEVKSKSKVLAITELRQYLSENLQALQKLDLLIQNERNHFSVSKKVNNF